MNIMMLLEMAASGYADRAAFIDAEAGTSITYQQLFGAAGVAAKAVQLSGASRLAMLDVSSLATPIGLFASGWAGVPYVPLNYRLTDEEIAGLLGRIKPVKLVTEPHRMPEFESATDVIAQTRNDFLESARSGGDVADPWSMDPEETAVLLFTSGTTGAP
ncbi:MAG: acyl--CoA ligase, partial [Proteobacteria bacterium]|nr:acyl--CoA ligase [Pseudomonadota bacterium]